MDRSQKEEERLEGKGPTEVGPRKALSPSYPSVITAMEEKGMCKKRVVLAMALSCLGCYSRDKRGPTLSNIFDDDEDGGVPLMPRLILSQFPPLTVDLPVLLLFP